TYILITARETVFFRFDDVCNISWGIVMKCGVIERYRREKNLKRDSLLARQAVSKSPFARSTSA
ncbi:MAG TPA: hypothetical protein VEH81_16120, partial [Ktedonobacteraceae bacterium]|nr:hypothetical protein [Ktedonobacteraceae bacterium]